VCVQLDIVTAHVEQAAGELLAGPPGRRGQDLIRVLEKKGGFTPGGGERRAGAARRPIRRGGVFAYQSSGEFLRFHPPLAWNLSGKRIRP